MTQKSSKQNDIADYIEISKEENGRLYGYINTAVVSPKIFGTSELDIIDRARQLFGSKEVFDLYQADVQYTMDRIKLN